MPFVKRVERIALAVENLDVARAFFEAMFDAHFEPLEVVEDMHVRYQPCIIGESRMELLEATAGDSPVARFLAGHGGPGVHHITFEVDDLKAAIAELEMCGTAKSPTAIPTRRAWRSRASPGKKPSCTKGYFWRADPSRSEDPIQ